MATIGTFTKKGDKFEGNISTLALRAKVSLLPNLNAAGSAPDYLLFAGKSDLGAAWEKTSKAGKEYLSVRLDDPSFAAPVFAALFEQEDGSYNLEWSRQTPA